MSTFGQLEKDFQAPFSAYQAKKTPKNRSALLKAVNPVLDTALNSFVGKNVNPSLRGRAKLIASGALDTYDFNRGSLKTHLMAHLQGLQRYASQQNQLIAVPERVGQDSRLLAAAENELRDSLNRDPSTSELADYTGFSPKRLTYVRQLRPAVTTSQIEESNLDDEGFGFEPGVIQPDNFLHRVQFVYDDLDPTDQLLVESSLGLNGMPKLSGKQLARKVNLSPGAVSQRLARIQKTVDELDGMGLF